MTLAPEAIESSNAEVTFARRFGRVRALMAILVLCALAATSAAAVLVPVDASVTIGNSHTNRAREYRDAAAKSTAKSGAVRRGTALGEKSTSDPC